MRPASVQNPLRHEQLNDLLDSCRHVVRVGLDHQIGRCRGFKGRCQAGEMLNLTISSPCIKSITVGM